MMIVTSPCWNCDKDIKIALLGSEDGTLHGGPECFSEAEVKLAEKHGVSLEIVDSKTAEESYLANICTHCGAFVGKWFFFAHYYTPALSGDLEYKKV